MKRPLETEHASYYKKYIEKVEGEDILTILQKQYEEMLSILSSLDDEKGKYSYAPGKWSIKELLGHVIDAERIFSFRALCFARGEQQPLPGFEQDDFVHGADFNNRSITSFADEYRYLRASNLILFSSFSDADLDKKGIASNNPVTVRALIFITAGHEKHHINILKERYLNN